MTYIFEWDSLKEIQNIKKHKISFEEAREIFVDPNVLFLDDKDHSDEEKRHYAVGKTFNGRILTVRFTLRENRIRIFGAAYWRKWRKYYEKNTKS